MKHKILHFVRGRKNLIEKIAASKKNVSHDDRISILACKVGCDSVLGDDYDCLYIDSVEEKYWKHFLKIKYFARYLDQVETEYVMLLDAVDVVICDTMKNIADEFEAQNCDVLFSYGGANSSGLNPKEINAGTVIGKTKALRELYRELSRRINLFQIEFSGRNYWGSEQINIAYQLEKFGSRLNIKVDKDCSIFKIVKGNNIYKYLEDVPEQNT